MSAAKQISRTQVLTESALMIALAVALNETSKFIPFLTLPQGGSITLFSEIPIILIAYRHGMKQGLLTAFLFSLIEMVFGFAYFGYVKGIGSYIILALFDYIIAYSVLGLGGIFRGRIKNKQPIELALGGIMVTLLRLICHIISGATIWGSYCPEGEAVILYSIGYNSSYMIPEAIITAVGLLAVGAAINLKKKNIGVK